LAGLLPFRISCSSRFRIYAKGFGGRRKGGGELVDARTVFQIGSTTKAFLAASMAITVDHGKVHWDDRVINLDPDFQLKDAWVTREFRVFDLLAQRAGLPPYANDAWACSASTRSR
jgi:CubicO group peptidase (beta-lactamase class C family)